jgi:hypothetical protein
MVGFNKFQSENDRPFSDNPAAAVFFLRISTKHGVDYRDWVGMQPGNMGKQWDSNGFKPHLIEDFSWLNMIERKKPGYSNPIFSCWRFFRKSWWISHSEWSEKPHYSRGLARLCSNEIQGSSFFFSKTLRLRIMTILWPYYDHILEF